jgi:hypothetical protein
LGTILTDDDVEVPSDAASLHHLFSDSNLPTRSTYSWLKAAMAVGALDLA